MNSPVVPTSPSHNDIIEEKEEIVEEDEETETCSQRIYIMADGEVVIPGTGQVRDPYIYYNEEDDSDFSNVSDHTKINTSVNDSDYIFSPFTTNSQNNNT